MIPIIHKLSIVYRQANLEFPEVQEKKEIVAENSHVSQQIAEKKEHQEDQEEMVNKKTERRT